MASPPRLFALCAGTLALALHTLPLSAEPKHDKPATAQSQGATSAAPFVDTRQVRDILLAHRALLAPASDLPPGIRKQVARGKPLPPGIAKRLDNRLSGRLPRYDGYEWRQVGSDVVLVALATGVVIEILEHLLD